MEELDISHIVLQKSLKSLHGALNYSNRINTSGDLEAILAAEDSIIQRFEYSYEGFWKFLKKYLERVHDIQDINSPKVVFRTSVKMKLCTEEEGVTLITMANNRNETSHTYSIEAVRLILPRVPQYYSCMIIILQRLKTDTKE